MGLRSARCLILTASLLFAGIGALAIYSTVLSAEKFFPIVHKFDLKTFPISLIPFSMSLTFSIIFVFAATFGLCALRNNIRMRKTVRVFVYCQYFILVMIIGGITLAVLVLCFINHQKVLPALTPSCLSVQWTTSALPSPTTTPPPTKLTLFSDW
ncbi:uncharacterized protein LOC118761471 [Octopus sinensis]|uniref:Uncharacterized protein LOC118761471 n=1 Tax=Octopus sinensis TaxID=2607531 RepID=A0A7E6EJ12_9MOLL|nr:uncharacterized protein LOC118761471 [Octopus sinensis]